MAEGPVPGSLLPSKKWFIQLRVLSPTYYSSLPHPTYGFRQMRQPLEGMMVTYLKRA